MRRQKEIPDPLAFREPEFFSHDLEIELIQARDEGVDLRAYADHIRSVAALPPSAHKEELADTIYALILDAKTIRNYPYREPSDLKSILSLCKKGFNDKAPDASLSDRIRFAWYGRIAGCLLGKPLEGIRTDELIPLLQETGNYPLTRWPLAAEMTDEIVGRFRFPLRGRCFIDAVPCAPADDDTNYTVMAQRIIDKFGRDFTPENVLSTWIASQPLNAYFTAERVAYVNHVRGFRPPDTASYKNHYREWIGAQIRADYYGYINPGRPDLAADMAWRDASISHVKNGIYGAMFVAAMLARAAVSDDVQDVIRCGMAYIPSSSRLYDRLLYVMESFEAGLPFEAVYAQIHKEYDEHTGYGWCHVIPNAMIVASALLYGESNFGKSICLAVQTGFDTDCNGATVGSVLGMLLGVGGVGDEWTLPLNGKLQTSIVDVGTVEIDRLVAQTLKHVPS